MFLDGTGHNATNINEFWQVINLPTDQKWGLLRLLKDFYPWIRGSAPVCLLFLP